MNYAQLVASKNTPGSIANWVNYSPAQAAAPTIVEEAESWIYRRLRHWRMLTDPIPGTMTIGQAYIDNPADMLEPFMLFLTGQYFQVITQVTPQQVIANFAYTGTGTARSPQTPQYYWLAETTLRFDSPPNLAYDYALMYFKQPAPLSETGTNFLTNLYQRLMRYACMAGACEFAKDGGQGNFDRTYWDQLAEEEIDKAQIESDRARRGTIAGAILIGGGGGGGAYPGYVTGY